MFHLILLRFASVMRMYESDQYNVQQKDSLVERWSFEINDGVLTRH